MAELRFEDPVERPARVGAKTEEMLLLLLRLKEHPDRWAVIGEFGSESHAYNQRRNVEKAIKSGKVKGKYELELRRERYHETTGKGEGGTKLYARFLGP